MTDVALALYRHFGEGMDVFVAQLPFRLVAAFSFGAILASFAMASGQRLATGLCIVSPPSRCESCGERIRSLHLVPVAGWLLARGRCAHCQAPIPPSCLWGELGLGLCFAWLALPQGVGIAFFLDAIPLAFLLALACADLKARVLPDAILLPFALFVFVSRACTSPGDIPSMAVFGLMAGLELYALRHAWRNLRGRAGLGAGDVKLAMVLGLLLQDQVFFALALAAACALVRTKLFPGDEESIPFGPWMGAVALPFLLV